MRIPVLIGAAGPARRPLPYELAAPSAAAAVTSAPKRTTKRMSASSTTSTSAVMPATRQAASAVAPGPVPHRERDAQHSVDPPRPEQRVGCGVAPHVGARAERHRRPDLGIAGDPRGAKTGREAAEASDLDLPATGETRRHLVEHHLHRELDVARDELGLLLRNLMDQLGLRHRPIVARALWGRDPRRRPVSAARRPNTAEPVHLRS